PAAALLPTGFWRHALPDPHTSASAYRGRGPAGGRRVTAYTPACLLDLEARIARSIAHAARALLHPRAGNTLVLLVKEGIEYLLSRPCAQTCCRRHHFCNTFAQRPS